LTKPLSADNGCALQHAFHQELRKMNRHSSVLFIITIMITLTSCKQEDNECNIGARGCQCTAGGTCDEGMKCNSHGICDPLEPGGEFKPNGSPCGGFVDSTTNLQWENPATAGKMSLLAASGFCRNYGENWRLPTIDELRTIVSEGCKPIGATGIGDDGICPISDSSTGADWNEFCFALNNGCEDARAGYDNCFFKTGFGGDCTSYYWSASGETDEFENSWVISFERGSIFHSKSLDNKMQRLFNVRCVCDPNPTVPSDTDTNTDDTSSTAPTP
jgi:hypothetical protein